MFIPKNERGEYWLDSNEPAPSAFELERAETLLKIWEHTNGTKASAQNCPHRDIACNSRRECLGKIAWWRRYIREIETCERGSS